MIMLNGVMMLPVGFPLTAISPSGKFSIAKGDSEIISKFFAIGRSIPSKSKVDQSVLDETLRLLILMMQQSAKPPIANKSNRVLSRKVFYPGTVTNGLNPDDIGVIGPTNTINNGAVQLFEKLKSLIDGKTVSPTFAGEVTEGDVTATEIDEVKRNQMMKVGASLIGVISLERQLAELRLHNILATWTKEIDTHVDEVKGQLKKIYRVMSVDTTLENGQSGERIIFFDPEAQETRTSEEVLAMEDYMKRKHGRNVRFDFVNSKVIAGIVHNWAIKITPTERDTTKLDRVLFTKTIMEAAQIFGPQTINQNYAKERYASLSGEDPDRLFTENQPQPQVNPEVASSPASSGDLAAQMMKGIAAPGKPSVRQLVSA